MGRGNGGSKNRGLDRAGEDHWPSTATHLAKQICIGKDQYSSTCGKALCHREGHHDPITLKQVAQHVSTPVPPGPTHAMCIIEIEMQCLIAMEELIEFFNGCQIAEHAVYAIDKVPDTLIAGGEFAQTPIERFHVVVPDHFHRGSNGPYMLYSHLDTVVNLLIHNHGIVFPDERGNGGQVSQRRGRCDQTRAMEET